MGQPTDTIPASLKKQFFADKEPPNLITDYDAIGFSVDHCLVKYNLKELTEELVKTHLVELHY